MSFAPTQFRPLARGGWGLKSVIARSIGGRANNAIIGITRDSAGVAVGSCRVVLFQTGGDIPTQTTTSDASGNYRFDNPGSGPYYIVAYKANAPDIAGTSANTLIAIGV